MSKSNNTLREFLSSDKVCGTILPLSQAVRVGNATYVSGNLGMNKEGEMATGIYNQTRLALDNIGFILNDSGIPFSNIVKVTVLLSDMINYEPMNDVYGEYFKSNFPARSAYAVKKLPRGALIEIEVIAFAELIDK